MALESGVTYIEDLVSTNPVGATDNVDEGDDHIRNIKTAVQGSFPSLGATAVTKTAAQINDLVDKSTVQTITGVKTLTSPVINTGVSGTAIDTDGTLAANSDILLASQKATKAYVDNKRVLASPPEVFTPVSTNGAWQTISLTTLSTAGAKSVRFRITINTNAGNSVSTRTLAVYTRKTGTETLTNKTLTSPVINAGVSGTAIDTDGTLAANSDILLASQKATKAYVDNKRVLASPPEVFTPVSINGAWQTISLTTLSTAGAKSVRFRITINTNAGNSVSTRTLAVYTRKTGSALGLTAATQIIHAQDSRSTAANFTARGSAEALVELDANQDFDLYLATNDVGFSSVSAALVEYYV